MSLIAIVAVGLDNSIGCDGKLLWHVKEDLKNYKQLTMNKKLVVGAKTWETLPEAAKKNRFHYVISSKYVGDDKQHRSLPSLAGFFKIYEELNEDVYIIGGEQIYEQLLPYCDKVIATTICGFFPSANKHFPMHLVSTGFTETKTTGKLNSSSGIDYVIREYEKNGS